MYEQLADKMKEKVSDLIHFKSVKESSDGGLNIENMTEP